MTYKHARPALLLLCFATAGACGSGSKTCGANPASYQPTIVAAQFSTTIDNKWLSFTPVSVTTYMHTSGNLVEQ